MSISKNTNQSELKFDNTLKDWLNDISTAMAFIDLSAKLFYKKSVELVFFKRQLIHFNGSSLLYRHSYAENIVGKVLEISISYKLAKKIYKKDLKHAKIDIGQLNRQWGEEKNLYENSMNKFLDDKLSHLLGRKTKSNKPVDVVIFGFGRIGRLLVRELIAQGNGTQLKVKAIVTRNNSPESITKRASLLRHDSVHGAFKGVAIEDTESKTIYINGHVVKMLQAQTPEGIDYEAEGIKDALLIDCTGVFRDRKELGRHLKAKGIARVLLTAPGKDDIPNIVFGVNHEAFLPTKTDEKIFSAASCTTNACVPILSLLENQIGIEKGHAETIHAFTNDQNLLDNFHKKNRRGRSAPINMVITSSGVSKAAVKAIPSLEGKLTANAVRVPVANVSLVILTLSLNKETSIEEINEMMKKAALGGKFVEQVRYSTSPEAASTDFIGESVTSIFDSPNTSISKDKKDITIYIWYDNEFGYAMQVIRLAKYIAGVSRISYL